jgi:hypothetical protein
MIYVVPITIPSFGKIDGYSFTFLPTDAKKDIGIHDVIFVLTDDILYLK